MENRRYNDDGVVGDGVLGDDDQHRNHESEGIEEIGHWRLGFVERVAERCGVRDTGPGYVRCGYIRVDRFESDVDVDSGVERVVERSRVDLGRDVSGVLLHGEKCGVDV